MLMSLRLNLLQSRLNPGCRVHAESRYTLLASCSLPAEAAAILAAGNRPLLPPAATVTFDKRVP